MDNRAKGKEFIGNSVVYFCHDGNGKFLMHKRGVNARDEQGKWDIGAGSMEFGDSAEQTLRREIQEEYGCEVVDFELIGYRDIFRRQNGRPTHWLALDFKVLIDAPQAKNNEPHKFDQIGWFSFSNLPADGDRHSQLNKFFQKYKDKLP